MTASERRFAHEMQVLVRMTLSDLMQVEKTRMPIGVWSDELGTVNHRSNCFGLWFFVFQKLIFIHSMPLHCWICIFEVQSITIQIIKMKKTLLSVFAIGLMATVASAQNFTIHIILLVKVQKLCLFVFKELIAKINNYF